MATSTEIAQVKAFLDANNSDWVDNDEMLKSCPALKHRLDDDEVLLYAINSVCEEANIPGGIEEHGYGDFLATNGTEEEDE